MHDDEDSWSRFFGLPDRPAAERPPQRSVRDLLFPRCATCGETCGALLQ